MKKLRVFFLEYYDELQNKVTWPKFEELQGNTIAVLVASLLLAIVVFGMDYGFSEGMKALYSLFQS